MNAQPSTSVAVRSEPLSRDQIQYIANTDLVPKVYRGNVPAIYACILTGRALGLDDMEALRCIYVVDGKATLSAELMVNLARRRGHSITGEVNESTATVVGRRADNGDEMTVTWTLDMARRAGLAGKANWQKYPEAMLWARAVSQLCRMLFPDVLGGVSYTPEELNGDVVDGEVVVDAPSQDPAQVAPGVVADAESPMPQPEPEPSSQAITDAQKRKLNVVIAKLVDKGWVTKEQLIASTGRTPVRADDGKYHFSKVRDSLTVAEASDLIDRLERYEREKEAEMRTNPETPFT